MKASHTEGLVRRRERVERKKGDGSQPMNYLASIGGGALREGSKSGGGSGGHAHATGSKVASGDCLGTPVVGGRSVCTLRGKKWCWWDGY